VAIIPIFGSIRLQSWRIFRPDITDSCRTFWDSLAWCNSRYCYLQWFTRGGCRPPVIRIYLRHDGELHHRFPPAAFHGGYRGYYDDTIEADHFGQDTTSPDLQNLKKSFKRFLFCATVSCLNFRRDFQRTFLQRLLDTGLPIPTSCFPFITVLLWRETGGL